MFGFGSFAEFAFADIGVTTAPTPIVVIDTHDGDHKKKRRFKAEVEARERRKAELIDIYEQLVEGRPAIVHKLIEEFIESPAIDDKSYAGASIAQSINYDKLLDSLHTIEALYKEFQEMDDEEVLLLL
jgi:hypothetical protein